MAVGTPSLIILWTAVLDLALFVLVSPHELDAVSIIAVAIVGAARVLAYARQKTAHEPAKAMPLAFLFLLLTGGNPKLDQKFATLEVRDVVGLNDDMIIYLIALEITLRILTDGSHAVLAWLRRRHGVGSEIGVWRTIRVGMGSVHLDGDPNEKQPD